MEWKKLDPYDLPSDILKPGVYEYKWTDGVNERPVPRGPQLIMDAYTGSPGSMLYRKTQPKPPSHKDIMTLWWKVYYSDGYAWERVSKIVEPTGEEGPYGIEGRYVAKDWFMGRESAVLPQEEE